MTSPVQDEFNELVRSKEHYSRHLDDFEDDDLDFGNDSPPEQFFEIDDYSDDQHTVDSGAMRSRYTVPQARSDANTGPKGVIADAQAFEQAKKSQRFSLFRSAERVAMGRPRASTAYSERSSTNASASEDEFLVRWRENRRRELQKTSNGRRVASRSRSRNGSPRSAAHGCLVQVDSDGYLQSIEDIAPSTTVVVFIFDDKSAVSLMVEDALRALARRHGTVKFIKFHYEDAEMHVAGVPAILAYRNGEKFADLVPVMAEIPDDSELSDVSLEDALQRILKAHTDTKYLIDRPRVVGATT